MSIGSIHSVPGGVVDVGDAPTTKSIIRDSGSSSSHRSRTPRVRLSALLGLIMIALAACLTPGQAQSARRIALGDPRLQTLLDAHDYTVTQVRRPSHSPTGTNLALVELRFEQPVAWSEWKLDSCELVSNADFVGIRWIVDLSTEQVSTVSQVLANGASCISE